jgi:VIT1/CCC1 family predicted Fe2+/Mn2+ transporter
MATTVVTADREFPRALALRARAIAPARALTLARLPARPLALPPLAAAAAKPAAVVAVAAVAAHVKENHGGAGSDRVKSIVFGGLDGVITTFSIVAAVAGASLPIETALLMGFSNLIADGISMGLGDFLSSKAEHEYEASESEREQLEFEADREGEVREQVELFEKAGVTPEDAAMLASTLSRYPAVFHAVHLPAELGIAPPDDDASPGVDGVVTFGSFLLFGSVPMWTYLFTFLAKYRDERGVFGITCLTTMLTMFALGVTQASITRQNRLKAGLLMTLNGSVAAASAFLVGWGLEHAIGTGTTSNH